MAPRWLALAGLVLLLAACGPGESSAPEPAPTAPTPGAAESAEAPAPAAPTEPATPAEPETVTEAAAPASASCVEGNPAAGAGLYKTYCATCHGQGGDGQGPAAAALNPKPARHDDGTYMNALSNEHLFVVTKEGGPAVGKSPLMAPWGGSLSDAQIWDLVAFVRSLADPPYACP